MEILFKSFGNKQINNLSVNKELFLFLFHFPLNHLGK